MKLVLLAAALMATAAPSFSGPIEASSGVSALLYQSVFSFQPSIAVETALGGELARRWTWQAGVRLGIEPLLPEAFVRLAVSPRVGAWRPSVGLELGMTSRARFEEGSQLLAEMRAATESDIGPLYLAVFAAPLSIALGDRWRLSVLELLVGTHLGDTGRTVRIQAGLVSAAVQL
jgi:hypothetical protein